MPCLPTFTNKSHGYFAFVISLAIHVIAFSSFIVITGNFGKEEQTLAPMTQIINIDMVEIVAEEPVIKNQQPKEKVTIQKTPRKVVATKEQPLKEIQSVASQKATISRGVISIEDYIQTLSRHINAYKYYPKSALRRQIEGLVTLSFKIDPQGTPYDMSFVTHSGHSILDNAAQQTLRRASPLPLPKNAPSRAFNIPIRYSIR
ncbi:MAG: energy transducer TonB [Alphaproteobacteria bacterium]|nr:energy transducer TonB [Alphaproteobacteria bacterium]